MNEKEIQLEPPFDREAFATALRPLFSLGRPRAISLPNALSPTAAKALRDLARADLQTQALADRGSYRFLDLVGTPTVGTHNIYDKLLASLRRFAEQASGLQLREASARILFFARGDYALRLDDAHLRNGAHCIEATLDLSPAPGDSASTVYSEDTSVHRSIAQLPGQISLVELKPSSTRCDRYRSLLMGEGELVLLRATFPLAES